MANSIFDLGLGLQQALFDRALAQQKAIYDESLKVWSRLFAIPRVIEWSRNVEVGTTPHEVVYQEGTLRLLRYRRDSPA
ncbi:MAG: hypothetical protein JO252_05370, partial [Planctomycetaceae bacterium]|nr:hypothetical protein [Planctomycetaceae bacterium]